MSQTHVFEAETLREAMRRVHTELGAGAVVTGTRAIREARRERPTRFEVTATVVRERPADDVVTVLEPEEIEEAEVLVVCPPPLPPEAAATVVSPRALSAVPAPNEVGRDPARALADLRDAVEALRREVAAGGRRDVEIGRDLARLRDDVHTLARGFEARTPLGEEDPDVRALVRSGVEPRIAEALVRRARTRAAPAAGLAVARAPDVEAEVLRALGTTAPLWGRGEQVFCALVGPTGAGKTRTAAKLAALAAFVHDRRVGVVTTDTGRIGGAGTLKGLCEVMGLPLRRAAGRRELFESLDAFGSHDLVLVDTPGAGPRDEEALDRLAGLVSGAAIERHLVVPAALPAEDVRAAARRFAFGGLSSCLVTKLDEARGPGAILSAAVGSGLPISHVADGQEVPGDCRAAEAGAFAAAILRIGA